MGVTCPRVFSTRTSMYWYFYRMYSFFFITICENLSRATRVMWFGLCPFMVRYPSQQLRHISMKWNDVRQMFPRKTRDVKKKSITLYAFYPLFNITLPFSLHSL